VRNGERERERERERGEREERKQVFMYAFVHYLKGHEPDIACMNMLCIHMDIYIYVNYFQEYESYIANELVCKHTHTHIHTHTRMITRIPRPWK